MTAPLSGPFATRVRRALEKADAGGSPIDLPQWRRRRDRLTDLLDPTASASLSVGDARSIIDLLSEAGPTAESRMSLAEWRTEVDAIVSELLGTRR